MNGFQNNVSAFRKYFMFYRLIKYIAHIHLFLTRFASMQ